MKDGSLSDFEVIMILIFLVAAGVISVIVLGGIMLAGIVGA